MSRRAASFTKSMRRDMLWLLSMSSRYVAGRTSLFTRSRLCGAPFSVSRNASSPSLVTRRPDGSSTVASSRTLETSETSVISNGSSTTRSDASTPSLA